MDAPTGFVVALNDAFELARDALEYLADVAPHQLEAGRHPRQLAEAVELALILCWSPPRSRNLMTTRERAAVPALSCRACGVLA